MKMTQLELIQGSKAGGQPVRRAELRLNRLISETPSEQLQGGFGLPPVLDDRVQNLALVIDCSQQIHALSIGQTGAKLAPD